ncbi:hypothetical protein WA1_28360 [Scytonema hofmannii PCC 7110]|uniref:Uncharacterized protein n=1 Tax=Scytonema hofmannii PCC 7110 TaxID=128403 RepID=A0A139X5D1_9CYAN|nr:hypothetical protein WA1_28360 [Scytonema hofmannii PCC 7110]
MGFNAHPLLGDEKGKELEVKPFSMCGGGTSALDACIFCLRYILNKVHKVLSLVFCLCLPENLLGTIAGIESINCCETQRLPYNTKIH